MGTQEENEAQVKERLEQIKADLKQRKASMKCEDACRALVDLGFHVKDGKRGGHKIYTHQGLPTFTSNGLNCGHGKNPEIKPGYIQDIINVLINYEDELIQYILQENS